MRYAVPKDIRGEDKPIGGKYSWRQARYVVMATVGSLVVGAVLSGLLGILGVPGKWRVAAWVAPLPLFFGMAALLAFAPAGVRLPIVQEKLLPGPDMPPSPDPFDEPIWLDQWIVLAWRFSRRAGYLPYRRGEPSARPLPPGWRR